MEKHTNPNTELQRMVSAGWMFCNIYCSKKEESSSCDTMSEYKNTLKRAKISGYTSGRVRWQLDVIETELNRFGLDIIDFLKIAKAVFPHVRTDGDKWREIRKMATHLAEGGMALKDVPNAMSTIMLTRKIEALNEQARMFGYDLQTELVKQ